MIIDFHTHVFSPRIKQNRRQYTEKDPCFAMLYTQKEARLTTADELIDSMDKNGIDISVVVNTSWATHELCVETNDYILESIARFPKRLIGFCTVQPQSCEAAVAEIERGIKGGIKGIGELRPDTQLFDFGDEEIMSPIVEVLQKNRLILLTHTSEPIGHNYSGKGAITPDRLYPFITRYLDLTIICAHWGGGLPFYALMPEVKKTLKNVYFDTAASPFLYQPQVYHQVSQLVGAESILFGSDYPLLTQGRVLEEIKTADLTGEAKDLILAGNARRLLGL
ncbi:MAG: amidohydrolase family protein [Dehalococcoidales bacterium]|nr:amidohydrolase family protein [Dehalococcoidales bacterium]